MNTIGVIPARLASTRFPNKPLANILGMPMIGHVYLRSSICRSLSGVYVATCDNEIAEYMGSIGGKVVMTSDRHERASDRTAEALLKIEQASGKRADIVVMIQGDEPMVLPEMIDASLRPLLEDPSVVVSNLMAELKSVVDFEDPNEIKVVVDRKGFALYFSREPIPTRRKGTKSVPMLKQVCIIPFRRDFLLEYSQMEPTPLEIIESIDMNRILENGVQVKMVKTDFETFSVDTREDLELVERCMINDTLLASYLRK